MAKSAAATGGLFALALPACGENTSTRDLAEAGREAFREGNYGIFRNVFVAPDEMRLIEEQLARDPESLPDGAAVLDFLIPNNR